MMFPARAAAWLVLLCLVAAPRATAQDAAELWPGTITGVAEARVTTEDGRFTTRLAFAAAVGPSRLRIEIIKGGTMQALVWYEEREMIVLVPGDPPIVHRGPPTQALLERTLGLPFCPAQVFSALRGGLAPEPDCGPSPGSRSVEDGVEMGGAAESGERVTLRFKQFRRDGGRPFPRRVILESSRARASLDIVTMQDSPKAPSPPAASLLERARRVSAAELARTLGVVRAPGGAGEDPASDAEPSDTAEHADGSLGR